MVKIEIFYKNGKWEDYHFVTNWELKGDLFVIKDNKGNEYNILTNTIWHIMIGEEGNA